MARLRPVNEKRLAKIMAYDICSILDDAEKGDLTYLIAWLTGEGVRQYDKFTDSDVEDEWREGDYDGLTKMTLVMESPTYERFEFVRQLWNEGDSRGLWVSGPGGGQFFGPTTEEFKRR